MSSEVRLLPEIWYQILDWLPWYEHAIIARVCKLWRQYAQRSSVREKRYINFDKVYYDYQTDSTPVPQFHKSIKAFSCLRREVPTGKWEFCSDSESLGKAGMTRKLKRGHRKNMFLPPGKMIDPGCFINDPVITWTSKSERHRLRDREGIVRVRTWLKDVADSPMKTQYFESSDLTISKLADMIVNLAIEFHSTCKRCRDETPEDCYALVYIYRTGRKCEGKDSIGAHISISIWERRSRHMETSML